MRLYDRQSHLVRDIRAVAAIEFAIWTPFMCLLLLGSVDLTRFLIATGRLSDVAGTMGQMLSVNTSGTVNYIDLQFYRDSAMVTYPQVLQDSAQQGIDWSKSLAITMTSIAFTPTPTNCTTNCTYVPKVVWSFGSNKRSCTATMTSAGDSASPSSTTLPASSFGPGSLIAVDIAYTFRPWFGNTYLPNMAINRSFYVSPRYVTKVAYQTMQGDPGATTVCS